MSLLALLRALPKLLDLVNRILESVRKSRAVRREHEKVTSTDTLIDDLAAGRVSVNPVHDERRGSGSADRPGDSSDGQETPSRR